MQETNDPRPKTVVLHQFTGIGDLIWHIPYFRAVAAQSRGGVVTVIAQPSTFARDILSVEECVEEVIDHDHRPRRGEKRKARHAGLLGMRRMAQTLKERRFDRIVLFSGRMSRGLLAFMSGIPQRLGYGYDPLQRLFLNSPPYIERYRGPAVAVLKEVSALAIAHGFCTQPLVPKMTVPQSLVDGMARQLASLPRPLFAFGIGTSEVHKQWGAENYAALASRIIRRGGSVLLLGGPGEEKIADQIESRLDEGERRCLSRLTRGTLLKSAAALRVADVCIGNDTGVVNMAAACDRPTFVLLGPRPLLDHDPLLHSIRAPRLSDISSENVMALLKQEKIIS